MNVPRGTFRAIKVICKRCMKETNVPLDASHPEEGDRDPEPWTEADEERWNNGEVLCPKGHRSNKPERKWCLRAKETDAVNEGSIAVWDERAETEEKS